MTSQEKDFNLIIDKLRNGEPEIRKAAAIRLGRIRDERAIPLLIEAMHTDDYALTRVFAIQAITWLANNSVIPELIKVIKNDKNPLVRKTAINAISDFRDSSYIDELTEIMQNENDIEVIKSLSICIQILQNITENISKD